VRPVPFPAVSTSRWDRPPPPHDWRWVVGTAGKVLIAVGILLFGFVAYQLWGTGIEYRQSQDALADDFAELLANTTTAPSTTVTTVTTAPPTTAGPTTTIPETTVPPTTAAPAPVPEFAAGDVMALLQIPSIGVETYVVSGVQPTDLKQGPGHYPDTPMPGQLGNSAIAGHRTTYGQPFYRLDELKPGDQIELTTVQGHFVYAVTGSEVVSPSQSDVISTTDPNIAMLTLTTCTPRYTAKQRLIVFADLDVAASSPAQAPVIETPPSTPRTGGEGGDNPVVATPAPSPTTIPGEVVTATTVGDPTTTSTSPTATATTTAAARPASEASHDAFAFGWFSDSDAFGQIALWGLALTAISIGAWLLSRLVRRNWVGALVGIVPFVLALYFFFQNVNRLLPAAL
jgi:sortase A